MHCIDAEFYPLEDRKKKPEFIKIGAIALSVLILALLIFRIYGWWKEEKASRCLVLVNEWNSVEAADFTPRLREAENGFYLDKACIKDFKTMLKNCRAQGCETELAAAYKSRENQEELGRSEFELGLAFEISSGDTDSEKWLEENSWRYGFILRYPQDKEGYTGVSYNPRHYRFVGKAPAAQIHEMGLCLEEYIEMFYSTQAVVKTIK